MDLVHKPIPIPWHKLVPPSMLVQVLKVCMLQVSFLPSPPLGIHNTATSLSILLTKKVIRNSYRLIVAKALVAPMLL